METKPLTLDSVRAVLNDYGKAVKEEYQRDLVDKKKPTTRNQLVSTARFIVEEGSGGGFEVSLGLRDYWKYVEYGRNPGKMPPVDKIQEWIRIKPIVPQADEKGKVPSERQLAFLIARSIGQNGIPPTNSLQDSVNRTNAIFREKIARAAAQDLQGYVLQYLFAGTE